MGFSVYLNTNPVFVIIPSCHGNGGWCGYRLLAIMDLKDALKIQNPNNFFDEEWCGGWGSLEWIRICYKNNPNSALYVFNRYDCQWEKK